MQNRLKPETSPVIQTLLKANIRSVMVTGKRDGGGWGGVGGKEWGERDGDGERSRSVYLRFPSPGDNMLTAVSVARECGMIPTQSRAIVVKASFPSTAKKPRLSYHAVGETSDQIHLLRSNSMSGTCLHVCL
jgi:magnesium-transporting ATPase (P-type)